MSRTWSVVPSPLGPLTLVVEDGDVVGLYQDGQRHLPPPAAIGVPGPRLPRVEEQLTAYFTGELTCFDVPLRMVGTAFQQRVWAALREVPYGETTTYGGLAARLGSPGASRAVGLANGKNPVCIIVPCHRVVGADGSLTGYAGGIERKRRLLDLERLSTT